MMPEALQYFHFLRPLWLAGIPVALLLWALIRPRDGTGGKVQSGIAPHLAAAMTVGNAAWRGPMPIDGVTLGAILLALAAAGPTWSRQPNPLVAETAPLVVALAVTESMTAPDLAPSRAERARFKILDLIAARAGARTALVAYAGSAHRVAPLTEDPGILRPLLEGLSPAAMPIPGNRAGAALKIASDILAEADTPGAILFVLDDLSPDEIAAFNAPGDPPRPPVVFLVSAPDSVALLQLDRIRDAEVVRIAPDDRDIARIERRLRSAQIDALAGDDRLAWQDRGRWLLWPAALLTLIWFRRGWTMRWSVLALAMLAGGAPGIARAQGLQDWFLTADQQGYRAFQSREFARAGELFTDPMWRGYAKYRAGQYDEAAEILATLATPEAAFAEAMSRLRVRQYRPAIAAFEKALERRPDYPEAARNLEIARAILVFVEGAREASDTGENRGIGADDIVFDNEEGRGADTRISATAEDSPPLTAQQWIDSIDTDMGAFLRSRFLLENAQAGR